MKFKDSKRRNKKKEGKTHIFATKVRCLHCGGAMVRSTTRSRQYDNLVYAYLKCKNHELGGDLVCKYRNRINYTDLYNYVEAEFIRVMGIYESNPEALDTTTRQIRKVDYTEETRKLVSALQIVEGDSKIKAKVLTNLYIDKAKGIVSDEDYLTISFTLQEEREQLELRKKDIKAKIDEVKKLENEKADVKKVVKDYLKSHKLTHEIVNETIDYIEIGAKEDGENRVINIYWKL